MATKEDVLEQIVEEYLISEGYFVRHNIRYLPSQTHPEWRQLEDSNHFDIDVLGINPHKTGPSRVLAVNCKSWQQGFSPKAEIEAIEGDKVIRGRKAWKSFRELCQEKWADAFIAKVKEETGESEFTHVTAVAKLIGDKAVWENHPRFARSLKGAPVRLFTFREMVEAVEGRLTTTLAGSEIGRILQMFKASGLR